MQNKINNNPELMFCRFIFCAMKPNLFLFFGARSKKAPKHLATSRTSAAGQVKSLFPKQESDLPVVLEHMKKLIAEQKALMEAPAELGAEEGQVLLTKHKDVPWPRGFLRVTMQMGLLLWGLNFQKNSCLPFGLGNGNVLSRSRSAN